MVFVCFSHNILPLPPPSPHNYSSTGLTPPLHLTFSLSAIVFRYCSLLPGNRHCWLPGLICSPFLFSSHSFNRQCCCLFKLSFDSRSVSSQLKQPTLSIVFDVYMSVRNFAMSGCQLRLFKKG